MHNKYNNISDKSKFLLQNIFLKVILLLFFCNKKTAKDLTRDFMIHMPRHKYRGNETILGDPQ